MDSLKKISCTLIPQGNLNILIPNSAIEEIIKAPISAPHNHHPCDTPILGQISWDKQLVPVFSANPNVTGKQYQKDSSIIVIIRNPDANQYLGFIATHSPSIIQANPHSLEEDSSPAYVNPYASRYIKIDNCNAIIPDINSCFSSAKQ